MPTVSTRDTHIEPTIITVQNDANSMEALSYVRTLRYKLDSI